MPCDLINEHFNLKKNSCRSSKSEQEEDISLSNCPGSKKRSHSVNDKSEKSANLLNTSTYLEILDPELDQEISGLESSIIVNN